MNVMKNGEEERRRSTRSLSRKRRGMEDEEQKDGAEREQGCRRKITEMEAIDKKGGKREAKKREGSKPTVRLVWWGIV